MLVAAPPPAVQSTCQLSESRAIELQDRFIRVRDVIERGCTNDASIEADVIAALPVHAARFALSRLAVAALVHRRVPGLNLSLSADGDQMTFTQPEAAQDHAERRCFAASRPLARGAALNGDDLRPAACTDTASPPLSYDRASGVVRAARDVAEGVYLGEVDVPAAHFPDAHDALTLSVTEGAVRIERQVTALQPAPYGGALFVQDEDGHVFSAALGDGAP